MKLSYKLENSTSESEEILDAKKAKIYGASFKKRQILYLLITLAYSILNNFIIKEASYLVFTTVLITINLVSLIGMKAMSNTLLSRNYSGTYRFFLFLNKFSKLLILLISVLSVLITDESVLKACMDLWESVYCWYTEGIRSAFKEIFGLGFTGILLMVNSVLFVIYLVMVVVSFFFYLPPVGIVTYFIWLFKNDRRFEYYRRTEEKGGIICEKRILNEDVTPYGKTILLKLLLSFIWLLVLSGFGYLFYRFYYLDFIGTIKKFMEIIYDEYGGI